MSKQLSNPGFCIRLEAVRGHHDKSAKADLPTTGQSFEHQWWMGINITCSKKEMPWQIAMESLPQTDYILAGKNWLWRVIATVNRNVSDWKVVRGRENSSKLQSELGGPKESKEG